MTTSILIQAARLALATGAALLVAASSAPVAAADECMELPNAGSRPQCGSAPTPLPPRQAPLPPPSEPAPPPPAPSPAPSPPPPSPAPPPTPPPPAPADSDADGHPDASDNCPTVYNDQADHDGDRIGDVCDPTPFQGDMVAGGTTFYAAAAEGASASTASRCKTQRFEQRYDQFGASWLNFVRYEGGFRVCYVLNERITSWGSVWGDASYTRVPWDWRGNDPGYPFAIRTGPHSVEFHYRGSAAVCVVGWACGPTKHPGITITFYDNNTMTKQAYVV